MQQWLPFPGLGGQRNVGFLEGSPFPLCGAPLSLPLSANLGDMISICVWLADFLDSAIIIAILSSAFCFFRLGFCPWGHSGRFAKKPCNDPEGARHLGV